MNIHFNTIPATFIHTTRTAGTSFSHWVEHNQTDYQNAPHLDIKKYPSIFPDYNYAKSLWPTLGTTFAFVRNPYSRLVSLYNYVGEVIEHRINVYKNSLKDKVELVDWKTHPHQSDSLISALADDIKLLEFYNRGFDYWVGSLGTREIYDHIRPGSYHLVNSFWAGETQASWFCGNPIDIVIKVENLETEFKQIQSLLNCYAPFPHVNKTKLVDYRNFYSQDSKQLVGKMFEEDLTRFKYEF
jgi:hypothetical protein